MSRDTTDAPRSVWRMFRWPLLLAVATAVGLVAALVADGPWDTVSGVLLAVPLVVATGCLVRRR